MLRTVRFIDLFAGLGGMKIGFEQACYGLGVRGKCVFTSEIKPAAVEAYQDNFPQGEIHGDITEIESDKLPDFDFMLAGFPCQPFSNAGTRQGFLDTRGTLFFEIERILEAKSPTGFLLENVEGLVKHDQGRTLQTIVAKLKQLGYQVTWNVLNAKDFGIAQYRNRIYIVGIKDHLINLDFQPQKAVYLGDILEQGLPILKTDFVQRLLTYYSLEELQGKAIKDKRGGKDNIHSWDLELKGSLTSQQKELLNLLLKLRRRKILSEKKGIEWMDGVPLTVEEIQSFYNPLFLCKFKNLKEMLEDLVIKGYLKYEHPKDIMIVTNKDGKKVKKREYRTDLPKGYNIVVGKLSFAINKILDNHDITPTLVATDMDRLVVVDGDGLRKLTIREGLRLFGFPESYRLNLPTRKAYDLLGNTVVIPVIKEIALRIIVTQFTSNDIKDYSSSPV
jgi:DNA (cytosine-5)-methyltransferase 1